MLIIRLLRASQELKNATENFNLNPLTRTSNPSEDPVNTQISNNDNSEPSATSQTPTASSDVTTAPTGQRSSMSANVKRRLSTIVNSITFKDKDTNPNTNMASNVDQSVELSDSYAHRSSTVNQETLPVEYSSRVASSIRPFAQPIGTDNTTASTVGNSADNTSDQNKGEFVNPMYDSPNPTVQGTMVEGTTNPMRLSQKTGTGNINPPELVSPQVRKYEGQSNTAGKMHGKGIMRYENGSIYDGEWDSGKRQGYGKYHWSNGDLYDGEWKSDNREGQGTHVYANGSSYSGEWSNGKRCGKGTMSYENGNIYEGDFVENKWEGRGVYRFHNGDVYNGEFKNGLYDGKGCITFAHGDSYTGTWHADKKHCRNGKYSFSNGNSYEGGFKDDQMSGHGILKYANGDIFDGDWKHDKKHGFGKYTWPNGNIKEGMWREDIFSPIPK